MTERKYRKNREMRMSTIRVEERMMGSQRENMMKMRIRATGELLWKEVQEAQGMVIPVPSCFLPYGPSTTSSRR